MGSRAIRSRKATTAGVRAIFNQIRTNHMSRHVFADDPIDNKDDDQLQRLHFANQVAELCVQVGEQSETSVMALVGAWGSGKSSILALASTQLGATHTDWN